MSCEGDDTAIEQIGIDYGAPRCLGAKYQVSLFIGAECSRHGHKLGAGFGERRHVGIAETPFRIVPGGLRRQVGPHRI